MNTQPTNGKVPLLKKLFLLFLFASVLALPAFSQESPAAADTAETTAVKPQAIPVKIKSYIIAQKQNSQLYSRAELYINDDNQTWEILLYRKKDSSTDRILMEQFEDIGKGDAVFRKITIEENGKSSGSDLFVYIPKPTNQFRLDFCNNKTEKTRRRLVLEL